MCVRACVRGCVCICVDVLLSNSIHVDLHEYAINAYWEMYVYCTPVHKKTKYYYLKTLIIFYIKCKIMYSFKIN